jgi:hypothetical protein
VLHISLGGATYESGSPTTSATLDVASAGREAEGTPTPRPGPCTAPGPAPPGVAAEAQPPLALVAAPISTKGKAVGAGVAELAVQVPAYYLALARSLRAVRIILGWSGL